MKFEWNKTLLDEEDSEDARDDPSWTRNAVEHSVVETDFIEQTTQERTRRKSECLSNDKPACEGGTPADADKTKVGAKSFGVHESNKAKTCHYSSDQEEIEPL